MVSYSTRGLINSKYSKKNRARSSPNTILSKHDTDSATAFSQRERLSIEHYISTISTPSSRATVIKSLSPRPETVAIII